MAVGQKHHAAGDKIQLSSFLTTPTKKPRTERCSQSVAFYSDQRFREI
jgi:hypothetical protein